MEVPKPEPGRWNHTAVVAKKPSTPKKSRRKHTDTPTKVTNLSTNHNPKSPKCLIKITGSRYNGTFLVSVDPIMDDAIYKTMREIEVGLGHQLKRKPSTAHMTASPKSCLSSVFKCFSRSDTLQNPIKKTSIESKKNLKSRAIEGMPKRESRPVWAKLPQEIEQIEGSHIKKFKSSSFKLKNTEENDVDIPRPLSKQDNDVVSTKASQIQKVEESISNLREKKYISNSDKKIVTLQTPKTLSFYECSGIEIGLEVKPEGPTREVSRLVPSAKEEVQIEVQEDNRLLQDGCRVSQNRDKRSLYVTVEEDVDGKPSLKLAFTGGNREDKNMKTDENHPQSNDAHLNNYVEKTHDDSPTDIKHRESKSCQREENKSFKSVEVQVSGKVGQEMDFAQFHKLKPKLNECSYPSKLNSFGVDSYSRNFCNNLPNYKRFPYKLLKVFRRENPNAHNEGGITVPENVTKMNRTPYLVHKLFDPNSIPSSRPKHIGAVYKMMEPTISGASNSRILKKSRLDGLSCSHFRNIGKERYTQCIDEECHDYHPKRDFGMSTSTVDDFEKVLQNICGPNYWYHRSETSNLSRHDEGMGDKDCYCSPSMRRKRVDMNCNLGNQTANSNGNITNGQSEPSNVNLLKKISFDKTNSDDTHDHSNADLRRRKIRTVHTCTDADLTGRENIGHLVLETFEKAGNRSSDLEALDMAKNEFLNKFKSLRIGGPKPSVGCCKETAKQDRTVTGNGYAEDNANCEDIENCEDIAFEMSPLRLGGGLYLKTRKKVVSKSVSGYTSDSTSNSFFSENQMNVINMASCNGMRREIGDNRVEGRRHQQQVVSNSRRAIKIKSRSCQDIFVSRNLISTSEVLERVIPKIEERRCQCFTAAGSGEGLGYGIFDKKLERGVKKSNLKGYNASQLERSSWRFHDILLPPEIGSSFLQRPSFIGASMAKYSNICGSQSAHRVSLDRLSTVVNTDILSDEWCPSNDTQVANSHTFVGNKKRGLLQRTILTIRKKITSLFGKKLVNESTRNVNPFTFNKHDKIVFIPVPLEKKYENIHLLKKKKNKFFQF